MTGKEVVKYVAIAFGAYTVYVYVRDGNLNNLFTPFTHLFSGLLPSSTTTTSSVVATTPAAVQTQLQAVGFSIVSQPVPTVNNGIKATVTFTNGQTLSLAVIPGSNGIFDQSGTDISSVLAGEEVNTSALIQLMQADFASLPPAATNPAPAPPATANPPATQPTATAQIAVLENMLSQMQAMVSIQPSLQPQIDALTQQIAAAKAAAGIADGTVHAMSGVSGLGDGQQTWMGFPVPSNRGWIN